MLTYFGQIDGVTISKRVHNERPKKTKNNVRIILNFLLSIL